MLIRPENEENTELDLGFFRRVKAIERDISRGDYADASLTSRLKSRQTNLDISDLEESIKYALNQYKEERPINLRNELKKKLAPELQKTVLEMKGPDQFENLIERYFEQNGASVLRPAKNEPDKEGDVDIIATFELLNLMVYVQAKRHDKDTETDTMAVNQIKQYVEYKSNNDDEYTNLLWVISTADKFTGDCINEARKSNVRLINGEEFSQMLLDTGIKHL